MAHIISVLQYYLVVLKIDQIEHYALYIYMYCEQYTYCKISEHTFRFKTVANGLIITGCSISMPT